MGNYSEHLNGSEIVAIVCNGFVQVIEYDRTWLRPEEIHLAVSEELSDDKYDNGIFRLTNTIFDWEESDTDEYGRKYNSEDHYIKSCDIEKVADVETYKTPAERKYIATENGKKRQKRLNAWLSSFDTDEYKYTVGKVWQYDPVCLHKTHGGGMSSRIHSFGHIKPTKANIEMIMKFCIGFLKDTHGIDAAMDYKVINGPERNYDGFDFFDEQVPEAENKSPN